MAEETKNSRAHKIKKQMAAGFERVGKLTRLQRFLICLLTFAVIGGTYYYFIFMPEHKKLQQVTKTLETRSRKLQVVKRQASGLKKWETKMQEVEQEFYVATRALPDKKELPTLLTEVSVAGSNAGLTFMLFQPNPAVNKEFYMEIPLAMKVEGTYLQIADFFFQVSRLNRIVNINKISMKKNKSLSGVINMSCNAVTYMFVEEPAREPKSGKKKKNGRKG
jgi:type IV pilus assembly protein PilO